jgi:hypothetical protein
MVMPALQPQRYLCEARTSRLDGTSRSEPSACRTSDHGVIYSSKWSARFASAWKPSTSGTGRTGHVLVLPDFHGADRIGEFWSHPQSRAFAELLIDCEEDRTLRAVLVGMLRVVNRQSCP